MATAAEVTWVYDHIVQFLQTFTYFENYMLFSALALSFYDFILTFDREVRFVWASRQSLGTMLFYGFRYPVMFNSILIILARTTAPGWQSQWSCAIIMHTQMALNIIVLVSATVFAALRIYAIYNCNRVLFGLVLVSGLVNPAISIYIFMKTSVTLVGVYTYMSKLPSTHLEDAMASQVCGLQIIGSHSSYQNWMIGARAAAVISDGLVLVLTTMRTFRRVEGSVAAVGRVNVLKQVLLRDTVVCFGLLCIVNVIGMATGHLDQWIEVMQSWVAILTSILLWRLALNLRETSGSTTGVDNSIEALDLSHALADSEPSTASYDQSELSEYTTSGDKGWAIELGIMSSERVPDIMVEM